MADWFDRMLPAQSRASRSQRIIGALSALLILLGPLAAFAAIFFGQRLFSKNAIPAPVEAPPAPAPKQSPSQGPLGIREKLSQARHSTATQSDAEVAPARGCRLADASHGLVTVAREDVAVMVTPSLGAEPISNSRGKPRLLDPRYDLKILEEKDDWLRIAVVAPLWPPGSGEREGWIEKTSIQRIDSADEKKCLFVDVLKWKGVPISMRGPMRDTALQILQEDRRCGRIARGGFLGSGQRFYFTCYPSDGGKAYHYWFSPMTRNRTFNSALPVDESAAINLCRTEFEKVVLDRAAIKRLPTRKATITAIDAQASQSVQYLTLTYQTQKGPAQKAYCMVPPGGSAEVVFEEL